ncbi:MAG: hypothetical protein PVJ28_00370, partial [Acidimicrobiia bacterium]
EDIDGILDEPRPDAVVVGFATSSIDFSARFWHAPDLEVREQLIDCAARAIDRRLRAEGIVIAFPQVVVWHAEEDQSEDS